MATIFAEARQTSPAIQSQGSDRQLRSMLDGGLITYDWIQAAIAEGIVHGVNTGTGTAPTTLNATYAAAEQDLYIYVPSGTKIIPLYIGIEFEDSGIAQVMDVVAGYSSNGDSAVTGTALTIYNYHTLASPATSCVATGVITAAGTTHLGGTDFLEFWRPYAGFAEDAFNGSTAWVNSAVHGVHWSAKAFPAPIIGGSGTDCALSIYAAAQAGTGFITAVWAEFAAIRLP